MDATTHHSTGKKSAALRPEDPDEITAKKPKAPLFSDESASRRVRLAIWSHDQKGGKVRYTVSICRSYYDEEQHLWVNSHYYNERDLDDVIVFAQEAKKKLARYTGEPESA